MIIIIILHFELILYSSIRWTIAERGVQVKWN